MTKNNKVNASGQLTVEVQHKLNALVVCKAGCDVEFVERRVLVTEVVEVIDDELVSLFTPNAFIIRRNVRHGHRASLSEHGNNSDFSLKRISRQSFALTTALRHHPPKQREREREREREKGRRRGRLTH